MKQTATVAPAQKSPFHPPATTATITEVMRPPLTTAGQYDHVAAAAYLMKHTGTTALMVVIRKAASRPASSPKQTSPTQSQTGKTPTTSGSML